MIAFQYDAHGSRAQKQTATVTTAYVEGLYERRTPLSGAAEHVYYVGNGHRVVAQVTSSGSSRQVSYLHDDHLGSTQLVTTTSGTVASRHSFDAFGRRRNPLDWAEAAGTGLVGGADTTIGYTGHEDDTESGLINMQGRLYDPVARQFLSPDPFVQLPFFSPSLNRYSYVLNNPLKYVDPTGYEIVSGPDGPYDVQDGTDASGNPTQSWQFVEPDPRQGLGNWGPSAPEVAPPVWDRPMVQADSSRPESDSPLNTVGEAALDAFHFAGGLGNELAVPWLADRRVSRQRAYDAGRLMGNVVGLVVDAAEIGAGLALGLSGSGLALAGAPVTGGASLAVTPAAAAVGAGLIAHGSTAAARHLKDLGSTILNFAKSGASSRATLNPSSTPVFRGGGSLRLRPGDFKVDPATGLVKTTHGPSLDTVAGNVERFGGARQIKSLPEGLEIIQRGARASHHEIVPARPMTVAEFQGLLNKVELLP